MRKADINRVITKRASLNRPPCCGVKSRVRWNRGTRHRRGIRGGFLEKMTFELRPEEIVSWRSKVQETPNWTQGRAWCVSGRERRDVRCSGENSETTLGRKRVARQAPVGSLQMTRNMALDLENSERLVVRGTAPGTTRSV